MYPISAGIQSLRPMRMVTAEQLILSLSNKGSVTMSILSVSNRSTGFSTVLAAGAVLLSLLSPAAASGQNSPAVLTSHSPWLAPTGHRQPTRADVPQNETLSWWEREQLRLDAELDRKLIICRGC